MIIYKIDILNRLKKKVCSNYKMIKDGIMDPGTIQNIKEKEYISLKTLDKICELLNYKIEDIILCVK